MFVLPPRESTGGALSLTLSCKKPQGSQGTLLESAFVKKEERQKVQLAALDQCAPKPYVQGVQRK
jgi:hypothetical protein